MIVRVDDVVEKIGQLLAQFVDGRDWRRVEQEAEVRANFQRVKTTCEYADGTTESLGIDENQEVWEGLEDAYFELWDRFVEQGERPWNRATYTLQADGTARLTFAYPSSDEQEEHESA